MPTQLKHLIFIQYVSMYNRMNPFEEQKLQPTFKDKNSLQFARTIHQFEKVYEKGQKPKIRSPFSLQIKEVK